MHKAFVDVIDTRDECTLVSVDHLAVTFFEIINDVCVQEVLEPITFVWKD